MSILPTIAPAIRPLAIAPVRSFGAATTSVSYLGHYKFGLGTGSSSNTQAAVDIGPADTNRLVILGLVYRTSSGAGQFSAVTINSVAATIHTQSVADDRVAAIVSATVPTGTSVSVVVTTSRSTQSIGMAVYSCTPQSTTPIDAQSADSGLNNVTSISTALSITAGGIVIAAESDSIGGTATMTNSGSDSPTTDQFGNLNTQSYDADGSFQSGATASVNIGFDFGAASGVRRIAAASWK